MSAYLPKAFDDADFEFFGKVLGGQQAQLPRETRAVHLIDQRLGHPLGKLYVAKYFPPESKAKVEALVANLLKAYDADIRKISWMTDATKAKALDKLHQFTPHVGYPDTWRDFSGLTIARDDLIGDIERSDAFEWRYRLDRIDRPVDRNEWNMTPPTVNAYYTSTLNSIFFPAAILQAPFFDPSADDAVNYGGIGAVMGHEIGHGFDDQGSKYSGVGKLESWWTDQDRAAFEESIGTLGAQYDSYEGVPGLHVNGKLTMGENIGDLSGLAISLQAYHYSLNGKPAPVIDGYTGDQRYFLGFAQIWRSKSSEASIRRQVLSNPHSPSHWRVIGPTRNVDAWYDAFNVKPGDKYYLPPDATRPFVVRVAARRNLGRLSISCLQNDYRARKHTTETRRLRASVHGCCLPPRRLRPVRRNRSDYRGDTRAQPRVDCCRREEVRLRPFPGGRRQVAAGPGRRSGARHRRAVRRDQGAHRRFLDA